MEENKTMPEEEIEGSAEEEAELFDDEPEEEEDDDVDFEFDEEGNVILHETTEEDEEDPAGEPAADEPEETLPDAASDAHDKENERLRERLSLLESQTRDTLKKLGVDDEDVLNGLAQLAADAEDVPVEEYLKKREDELKAAKEEARVQNERYEAMARADLAELQAAFPELKSYTTLADMPKDVLAKFAHFRENLGLSAKEAYSAANPDGVRAAAASAVKAQAKNDGKSHLRSSVPKGANVGSRTIPKKELESWMEDLGVSKEEAIRLYRKTL